MNDQTDMVGMLATFLTNAIGMGSAEDMLVANAVLSIIFIASSLFTLGWTLVLLVFTIVFATIAVLRIVSKTFDKYWPLA